MVANNVLLTFYVCNVRYVAQRATVQCIFVSDGSLSKHLLHTQVKGSNFILFDAHVIDVVCGPYFGV